MCNGVDGSSFFGGICDEGGYECEARPDYGVYGFAEGEMSFARVCFCWFVLLVVILGWLLGRSGGEFGIGDFEVVVEW